MGGVTGGSWSLTARPCDSCKAVPAAAFCRADSAFLCASCDERVHAANRLASRHARVPVCDVCEHAPAAVTCRADAAALCHACDRDIHSANPLARRHERLPVVPFFDALGAAAAKPSRAAGEFSEEEAEAASWLLPDPNSKPDLNPGSPEYKSGEYSFSGFDLDLVPKQGQAEVNQYSAADGVVPEGGHGSFQYPSPVVDGYPTYEMDYPGTKPFLYNFTSQSISQSMSSLDVGVVPDHNAMVVVSKTEAIRSPLFRVDREARVLRYREKRKMRKFEKTIRYASRKAYAETRPRIKGRFAKRSELQADPLLASGVIPTYLSAVVS